MRASVLLTAGLALVALGWFGWLGDSPQAMLAGPLVLGLALILPALGR